MRVTLEEKARAFDILMHKLQGKHRVVDYRRRVVLSEPLVAWNLRAAPCPDFREELVNVYGWEIVVVGSSDLVDALISEVRSQLKGENRVKINSEIEQGSTGSGDSHTSKETQDSKEAGHAAEGTDYC